MRNVLSLLVTAFVLIVTAHANAASTGDVLGVWYTEGKEGGVELYNCEDKICGRFHWLKADNQGGSPDTQNPDPAKRSRNLCHLQFMGNFTPDGKGHYSDGWIYSPRHGQVFNAEMTLVDRNTLDLHGYVLTPVLGQSQIWTRAEKLPVCTVSRP